MDSKTVTKTAKTTDKETEAADVGAASEFSPSGAPRQVTDIDVDHPAVDNDPRAGTTTHQNRIDFNDPTIEGHEAVKRALKAQA